MEVSRRDLFKMAEIIAMTAAVGNVEKKVEATPAVKISQAPVIGSKNVTGIKYTGTAAIILNL